MNTESLKIESGVAKELYHNLLQMGFVVKSDPNPYLSWKLASMSITAMYYSSGKLVLQGKGDLSSILELVSSGKPSVGSYVAHVGADEVGKGDYFGPLVVCACFVPSESYATIVSAGAGDSKAISDVSILKIYNQVKDLVRYSVKVLEPSKFNSEYARVNNIAKVLANLHGENIRELVGELSSSSIDYNFVMIDQFSANKGRLGDVMKGIEFKQMHKAESSDLPTAVASIIARRYFLTYMENMSLKFDFPFPKGASNVVDSGRRFVEKYGRDELDSVAKVSFRTTAQVLL